MRIKSAFGALLCAGCVTSSAFAGQVFDPDFVPALRIGLSFGGPDAHSLPFELALQMQDRAVITQKVIETGGQERIEFRPLSLDMIKLTGSRTSIRSAYVFSSPDLLAGDNALNADGASKGSSNWVWWTVGGVAAAAATVLVAGGGGNEITVNGNPDSGGGDPGDQPQGCDVIGGNITIPDDISPTVLDGPGCPP